ncbi:hypothetical protein [Kitasatospora griseola]|uniref:hypothetical protein n=1 Tax=Kitasatospora griseola TaxID=2064 RepID=UPI003436E90C
MRRQHERALEVLAAYVATGWWPAAPARAELLGDRGRADGAFALCRPHAQAGDRLGDPEPLAAVGPGGEGRPVEARGVDGRLVAGVPPGPGPAPVSRRP